jgi:16S rRNA C967 or C1407 C5-methylase (RsmB/RsmF family)
MWSPNLIRKFSKIQKKLITKAFELLTPGGILVYSTCTQEPEENEAIITWFLSQTPNAKLEEINLDINRSAPIKEWKDKKFHKDINKCLRIYPQDNDSEGFFVAKIKKT